MVDDEAEKFKRSSGPDKCLGFTRSRNTFKYHLLAPEQHFQFLSRTLRCHDIHSWFLVSLQPYFRRLGIILHRHCRIVPSCMGTTLFETPSSLSKIQFTHIRHIKCMEYIKMNINLASLIQMGGQRVCHLLHYVSGLWS